MSSTRQSPIFSASAAPKPGDRRRVLVALTPKTHRLATSLYEIPDQAAAEFQRQFSDDDLRVLIRYFEHGLHLADLRMSRLRSRLRRRGPAGRNRAGAPMAVGMSAT